MPCTRLYFIGYASRICKQSIKLVCFSCVFSIYSGKYDNLTSIPSLARFFNAAFSLRAAGREGRLRKPGRPAVDRGRGFPRRRRMSAGAPAPPPPTGKGPVPVREANGEARYLLLYPDERPTRYPPPLEKANGSCRPPPATGTDRRGDG